MRKKFLAIVFLMIGPVLAAQQTLNNDAIIKMVKAGLSEELVITTIDSQAGTFDTSTDGLIALKAAGVNDKVVSAIVRKASGTAATTPAQAGQSPAADSAAQAQGPSQQPSSASQPGKVPRVFLQSASKGSQWNAVRDQSMEMSKDFEKDCPGVKVTINQGAADYTVLLNHIEHGFARDNQIQIANKDGDLISKTKEGGSIRGDVKKACETILADWSRK
jgi:hypothetical protein